MTGPQEKSENRGRYFDPSTGSCEIKRQTTQGDFNCNNLQGCKQCDTADDWKLPNPRFDNPIDAGLFPPMGDID